MTTTLPARAHEAAETMREMNALYGYHPDYGMWNPIQMDKEADVIEEDTP